MLSKDNLACATIFTVLLFLFSTFSPSSSNDTRAIGKCTSTQQCDEICFTGGELLNRCDANGTCVCDCHDKDIIGTASYTEKCAGPQPEGDSRTACSSYCTQEYQRPSRYCTTSSGDTYCTAVCVNSSQPTYK
ncbi:unnamed protein product [Orchesella dallaii]|uniref:Defensin-like protein n=1 Tax=Orchesella dallaii TaxID=48710 RepID=A0ABP1QT28_9HEXA